MITFGDHEGVAFQRKSLQSAYGDWPVFFMITSSYHGFF
jgi:hypothetical protein